MITLDDFKVGQKAYYEKSICPDKRNSLTFALCEATVLKITDKLLTAKCGEKEINFIPYRQRYYLHEYPIDSFGLYLFPSVEHYATQKEYDHLFSWLAHDSTKFGTWYKYTIEQLRGAYKILEGKEFIDPENPPKFRVYKEGTKAFCNLYKNGVVTE